MTLLRDRPFVLVLSARTVSVAGYAITSVALPLLVLQLAGSAFLTALVAAIEVVPYFLFGLIAGAMIAWGGTPFGALLGGLIAELGSVRLAYLLMPLAVATSAALSWRSPLRGRDLIPPMTG